MKERKPLFPCPESTTIGLLEMFGCKLAAAAQRVASYTILTYPIQDALPA
jgi:hypothetical protein